MNRRVWLRSVSAGLVASLPGLGRTSVGQDAPYQSPYSLKFRHPLADLEAGLNQPPWNDPALESEVPAREARDRPVWPTTATEGDESPY